MIGSPGHLESTSFLANGVLQITAPMGRTECPLNLDFSRDSGMRLPVSA